MGHQHKDHNRWAPLNCGNSCGAFNKEKAIVGVFSGHCETSQRFIDSSTLHSTGRVRCINLRSQKYRWNSAISFLAPIKPHNILTTVIKIDFLILVVDRMPTPSIPPGGTLKAKPLKLLLCFLQLWTNLSMTFFTLEKSCPQ